MLEKIRLKLLVLHDYQQETSDTAFRAFLRACLLQTGVMLFIALALVYIGELSIGMTIVVCLFPFLWPLLLVKQLDNRIAKMKLQFVLELPIFVNKLLLMLQAGQTLHSAMTRASEAYATDRLHPFARQMTIVHNQLLHASPFVQAVEGLARRCGTQEVTFFTSAILMNYKRGGDELVSALRSLSRDLWDKRRAAVKTLGEEASAKMIFPLMLIFLAIMIAVGAPAIMQLN
jgi:tight adherence protein C